MNKTQDRTLDWLLEPADIGVRYLALRDLVDAAPAELSAARTRAHREGPIARVLDQMEAAGYWLEAGPGYYPKYRSTVWSVILLAQLGASAAEDERVGVAGAYLLDHALSKRGSAAEGGRFSANSLPSGTADCLQGNLCAALLDLGCRG